MTLEELRAENPELKDLLAAIREGGKETSDDVAEWQGERTQRDTQVGNRPDKLKDDGSTIAVNKIAIPFNKSIVKTAASFLFGQPVGITAGELDLTEFNKGWENLNIDSKLLEACKSAKAFKHSAILFRIEKDEATKETKFKANVLDPTKGSMYAIWRSFDELDAFVWETKTKNEEGDDITKVFIFDQLKVETIEEGDEVVSTSSVPHLFDRIPVVYFEEEDVEYEDVKDLIDRFEMNFSKFSDTNDYFAAPKFKATGTLNEIPSQDETGTVYQMDVIETDGGQIIKGDLELITWDSAPVATKMEFEIAKGLIYDLSHTPDLSFDNVKGLGNISGVALKLMFLSTIMKAKYSEIIYKVAVKRVISILMNGFATMGTTISSKPEEESFSVKFNSILPDNLKELLEVLGGATMDGIMSKETALKHNPMVKDPAEELIKIAGEKDDEDPLGATQE